MSRELTIDPVYTGPVIVGGRAAFLSHDKAPMMDPRTKEYRSGNNCVGMIGLAQCLESGVVTRVRLEMTPEEARDLAMQLLGAASVTGQISA